MQSARWSSSVVTVAIAILLLGLACGCGPTGEAVELWGEHPVCAAAVQGIAALLLSGDEDDVGAS